VTCDDGSVNATALLVDMRNFTPTYQEYTRGGREAGFLALRDRFYGTVAESCRAACRGAPDDSLYLNSTGDGVLAVFREDGERHALRGYLACLHLLERLPQLFGERRSWEPPFGIGMESGEVTSVGAGPLATCIGHCINLAARLEALTKTIAATTVIIGEQANALLVRALHDGEDYGALVQRALEPGLDPDEQQTLWQRMRAANDALALHWFGSVNLKGVDRAILAFRLAPTLQGRIKALVTKLESQLG